MRASYINMNKTPQYPRPEKYCSIPKGVAIDYIYYESFHTTRKGEHICNCYNIGCPCPTVSDWLNVMAYNLDDIIVN